MQPMPADPMLTVILVRSAGNKVASMAFASLEGIQEATLFTNPRQDLAAMLSRDAPIMLTADSAMPVLNQQARREYA